MDLPERLEGFTITGQVVVRDGASGDWVGLDGVSVRAVGRERFSMTQNGGFFQLDRLPLGAPVSLDLRGPRTPDEAERRRRLDPVVGLVDGQAIDLGVVQLGPTGALEGRVLVRPDPAELAVPGEGAIVVAAGTAFRAVSDAAGGYELRGLPEGVFDLAVFRAGFRAGRAAGVRVLPGASTRVADFELEPAEASTVSVAARALKAELTDPNSGHGGLTAAFFRDTDPPSEPPIAAANTGADGRYRLELPIGVYRVEIRGEQRRTARLNGVAVLPEGVLGLPTVYVEAIVPGDSDGDGIPDDVDDDDDNDGCADDVDAFPTDPAFCFDTDGDGIADAIDPDDDNDGLADAEEVSAGADGWITDPLHVDTDRDGVEDLDDVCPTVPDNQVDTDQDGIGDACEDDPGNPNPRPRIRAIAPLEAGAGTIITIRGSNLFSPPLPTAVQFGLPAENGGTFAPFEASADILRVTVPESAQTGFIRVFAGGQSVTSTQTFTFRPSPTVVDYTPRQGRIGSQLRIVGQNFDAPDLQVFVGGVSAEIIPHPTHGDVRPFFIGQTRYDSIEVVVPDTTTGRVQVQSRFGVGDSLGDFIVSDAGIVITALVPSSVPIGAVLRVLGNGFSTDDLVDPDPVEVIFDIDGPNPIRQGILPGSVDSQILVEVPAGAVSGVIGVDHPALDRPVRSPLPLIIDPLLPSVTDVSDRVIAVGDTLQIFGNNLGTATRVSFGGGAAVTSFTASSGTIQLTVPAGVAPGPVSIETPRGVGASPFDVGVLEIGAMQASLPAEATAGGGFGRSGTELFVVSRANQGYVLTATTGGVRLDRNVDLSAFFDIGEIATTFAVSPSGDVGVVGTTRNRALVLTLPSFGLVGACSLVQGDATGSPLSFDEPSNAAFAVKAASSPTSSQVGVVRIDLATGNCQELNFGPRVSRNVFAMLVRPNRQLLMVDASLGEALADIDPMSSSFGTLVQGWTQVSQPLFQVEGMIQGLASDIFLLSFTQGTQHAFLPFTRAPAPVLGAPQRMTFARTDGVARYLVGTTGPTTQIIDTAGTPRLVRRQVAASARFGAGIPGQTGWVLSDSSGRSFRRLDLRAP